MAHPARNVVRELFRVGLGLALVGLALWWLLGSLIVRHDNFIVFVNESEEDFGTVTCSIRRGRETIWESSPFLFDSRRVCVLTYKRAYERDLTLFVISDGKMLVERTMIVHGRYGQTTLVSYDAKNKWRLGSGRIGWGDDFGRQRDRERGLVPSTE